MRITGSEINEFSVFAIDLKEERCVRRNVIAYEKGGKKTLAINSGIPRGEDDAGFAGLRCAATSTSARKKRRMEARIAAGREVKVAAQDKLEVLCGPGTPH